MAGVFIAIEGIDGSGKSTIAERLVAAIRASGRDVLLTREPGGTAISEAVRGILLDERGRAMAPETEALLFAAARAQLVAEILRPALQRGAVVVSDRFVDSSLAYQWGGRGLARDQVAVVQQLATGGLEPDLKLLLDLPVPVALRRRLAEESNVNRLDRETEAFFERVQAAYRALAATDRMRWRIVDAGNDPDAVWEEVVRVINESGLLGVDVDDVAGSASARATA